MSILLYDPVGRNFVPQTADPASLKDGDFWITDATHPSGAGVFARVNGSTVNLSSGAGGGGGVDYVIKDYLDAVGNAGFRLMSGITAAASGTVVVSSTAAPIRRVRVTFFPTDTTSSVNVTIAFWTGGGSNPGVTSANYLGSASFSRPVNTNNPDSTLNVQEFDIPELAASSEIKAQTLVSTGSAACNIKAEFYGER